MRISTMVRLAAPMLLCIAGAAQAAGPQDDDLRVIGSRTPAMVWRAAVARDISTNLSAPRPTIGQPPEGMVEVSFQADARGRIDQISVITPSGSPALNRAAVMAISRMRTLRVAPAGIDATRAVEAWVYFANTDATRPVEAWVYFANTDAVAERYEATLRRTAGDLALDGHTTPLMVSARG